MSTIKNALWSGFLYRLVFRFTRRKRWENEVGESLLLARHAAKKLMIEIQRGTVEPKAEYDRLIARYDRLLHLGNGPNQYDKPDYSGNTQPPYK